MIFVGIIIGFLFGCGLGFAVGSQPQRPTDTRFTHRVRYAKAQPMQPRKWEIEE